MPIFKLSERLSFPPARFADKNGLLAFGGDLSARRLLQAYKNGIFPWYSEGDPILWWSPDPRLVIFPDEIKISKSLNKLINKNIFRVSFDQNFEQVIHECAAVRLENGEETWILSEMKESYIKLHNMGYAHSVEVWKGDVLAGGLYGVSIGKCFFGESMFSRISNSSKVGLVTLALNLQKLKFDIIDCQVRTNHLITLGAREIPRDNFLKIIKNSINDK